MWRPGHAVLILAIALVIQTSVGIALGAPAEARASSPLSSSGRPSTSAPFGVNHTALSVNPQAVASSQGGGNLANGGGPVQVNPKVFLIFWGSEWGSTASLSPNAQLVKKYFQDLGPSYFDNVLTQYSNISNVITLGGAYVDTAAPPTDATCGGATVEDSSVQSEVTSAITATGWPTDGTNALYLVFTPSSSSINNGAGACSEQIFCSYHKWSTTSVAYAAIPFPSGSACQVKSSPNNNAAGDSLVNLASSMYFGAATDPRPGIGNSPAFPQPGSGWVDGTGLEIGQKCAWNFAGGATPLNNGDTFQVQTEYSNAQYGCTNDYAPHIAVSPGMVAAVATSAGASPPPQTLTIQNTGAAQLNWQLASSLPSWVAVTPTAGVLAPTASQQLTLTFSLPSSTQAQTYSTTLDLADPVADNTPLHVLVVATAADVSKTWYFAEGYTASGFDTYLTIANPNSKQANVTVKYLLLSGPSVTKTYLVNANARGTIHVNDERLADPSFSMVVTSDQPVVVERPMYFTDYFPTYTVPGGTDSLGATGLSQDFSFGYLDTTTQHDTFLTILNPNATSMAVTTDYSPAAGGSVIETTNTVPANARGTIHVNLDHGLAPGVYSARVHLSAPGLVERPLYFIDSVTHNSGAADYIGVSAPQTNWYFAEGWTAPTFSERYVLANPCLGPAAGGCGAAATAHVTLQFMDLSGQTTNRSFTLTPGQQQVVDANALLGDYSSNSAKISADQPILAERLMSFRYVGQTGPLQGGANYPGATDVLGTAAPSHVLYFSEGYTDYNFAEYLTLQNPDPASGAWVALTYLPLTGSPYVQTVYVGPHTRATVFTNQVVAAAHLNTSISLIVESNLPIVAERPIYFDANGTEPGASDIVGYQPIGS